MTSGSKKPPQLKPLSSEEIVDLRKSLGLNQGQFWGRIGVTQSGGSRYETGRKLPKPVRMLVEIAYRSGGQKLLNSWK